MSGILGIINKNNKTPVEHSILETGINSIKYKNVGATHSQTYKNVGVAVYDQFGNGSNRYIYENERVLTICDAEIYNYNNFIDINSEGVSFSEAKIISDLFLKYGEKWWEKINGVYSAFIWDKEYNKGFVFTDRIGIKPIVIYEDNEQIIISSRIRCINVLPDFDKQIDKQAVFSYFFMEMIPTPYTIYSNIKKLESGYFVEIQNNSVETKLAWKMVYPEIKISNLDELRENIYLLTKNSIKTQLSYRANVNRVGCFLSGGTDSSTIAGIINELYPGSSKTFSIGFDEPGYDEMYYARIAAKKFATKHYEYYVTSNDIIDTLPKIVELYDEPFANSSIIPAYYCAKLAKENGVDVLLGGDGGDEIFGGNARYRDHFANFARIPPWLVSLLWSIMKLSPEMVKLIGLKRIYNYVKRARSPIYERIHTYSLRYYIELNEIFDTNFFNSNHFLSPEDISKNYIQQAGTDDVLDQFLYNDLKLTLMDNDLRKVSLTTELANINTRYPFLDHQLVEFTGKIPASYKVKDDQLKYIFKQTFQNLLPIEILKKTKHGFGLPVVPWMLRPGKLNDLLKDYLFGSRLLERGIFRKPFIKNLYNKAIEDRTTFYGNYIYHILFLEMWMQTHFDS